MNGCLHQRSIGLLETLAAVLVLSHFSRCLVAERECARASESGKEISVGTDRLIKAREGLV